MFKPLRALILEDRASDVELMSHELRRAGFKVDWQQVDNEADYCAHLDPALDIILADYSLPQFSALRALQLLRERGLDIPFIVITGSIGEEVAVECMHQGAADYLLKDRLARLGQAIEQALERKRLRAERRQAEETLRESEARYKRLADSITDIFFALDKDLRFTYWNKATEALTGVLAEDAIGKCLPELFPGVTVIGQAEKLYRDVIETQRPQTLVMEVPSGDQLLFFEISAYPSKSGLSVFARDITESRRTAEALAKSEREKAAILDAMSELMVYQDTEMRVLWANRTVGESVGLTPEQLVGRRCYEIWGQGDRPCPGCPVEKARLTGQPQEAEVTHADGRVWFIRGYPVRGAKGEVVGIVELTLEITERKRAEERLSSLLRFQGEMLDTAAIWIDTLDAEGNVTFWNRAAERISGYSREEVLGHGRIWEWLYPDPDYRAQILSKVMDIIQKAQQTENFETTICCKGGEHRVISWHSNDLMDDQGKVAGSIALGADVTEHKRLEEQFLQAQKMESIGRLAGGVAHDFNNLLTVINLYSDMALRSLEPDNPLRQDLEEIHKAGDRAAQLTRQLLAFSRRQVLEMHTLNLNEVLESLAKMLPRLIGEDVTLEMKPAPDLGNVRADPGQIEQVAVNLAVNARDAMPEGGRLTIETNNVTLDQAFVRQHMGAAAGEYVMLAISDTGLGMTDEVKEHLFEPFFTTKGLGKGTGLGLATMYGIVKQHQGHIWVYSEPGLGSTFKIYLPRVEEELATLSRADEAATLPRGSETVLVVEDEPAVRGVAVRVLSGLGYRVLEASHGAEALQVAATCGQAIHLLLTDVVMPEMNGKALSEQLTVLYPGLKVLFVSGYTDETIAHRGVLDEGVAFLQKPFTPARLARKVREVLDK